ncbi:MAG: aspartate-semialdehyde dehydrogenase [Halodesulfurarchaeum sp.]
MIEVGILGATGAVGQRFVELLDDHPFFSLSAVTASEDSVGKRYEEAAKWRVDTPIPDSIRDLTVGATRPDSIPDDVDLVFSSLPSSVAERVEPDFLEAGYVVSSNSSNARLDDDVPLVIPEVNPEHMQLIDVQREKRGWSGALVKNPNCSTITMVPPLAALDRFGIEAIQVSTLQAVSGAGYSGVTSMEIIDNALPYIGGEEEKMETESKKLLGELGEGSVAWHDALVAASCNRIPTIDGHLENVFVELEEEPSVEDVKAALRGAPTQDLPTAPDPLIHVFDDPTRPQPRLDRLVGDGMAIAVGGVKRTDRGVHFNVLSHNTIRGAAGASVLNGELLVEQGWL